jgi:hypothetical protein
MHMPEAIDLDKIAAKNPHLDVSKIKASCAARKSRVVEKRGYNLALPSERRRAITGHQPGCDPRTIRIRASLNKGT